MKLFGGLTNVVSLTLPKTLTKILNNSFEQYEKIENINMPKSITYIARSAFFSCDNLENFTIDGNLNGKTKKVL